MRLRGIRKLVPRFATAWAVSFAALLGVASGLAGLYPSLVSRSLVQIGLLVVSVAAAAAYAWNQSRPDHLPAAELLPDALAATPCLTLECTKSRTAVLSVHRLTEEVYPGIEALPPHRYERWLEVNPSIFVCLFDRSHQVLGYFDIFPLRDDFLAQLVAGTVGEQDIRTEHMLTQQEARSVNGLYLGGVAVRDWHCHEGRRFAAILVWGLLMYLEHFYGSRQARTLYAHAVTRQGEQLLQKFEFQLVAEATGRKDPFRLYAAQIDDAFLDMVRTNVPDFSHMVRLGWTPWTRTLQLAKKGVA